VTEHLECPLCGSSARLRHAELPGYLAGQLHQVYGCSGCQASFTVPRKEPAGLYDRLYQLAGDIPGYHRYERYARLAARSSDALAMLGAAEDVYWAVARAVDDLRPNATTILEIGSGLGYVTYALAQRGFAARGLDVSGAAVDAARRRFGDLYVQGDLAAHAASRGGEYDVVLACEVIEHLEDPVGFVRSALALVKPGGRLVLTTPNRSLYDENVLWETEPPPVHFWWFTERGIQAVAERAGTTATFVDFGPYQERSPLYLQAPPPNVPTRQPTLTATLEPSRQARVARLRGRLGAALSRIRNSGLVMRLRGWRRVTGARRTVLCAVLPRPTASRDGIR